MDEWTLNDLLECSVCLERLDTSSKVLPCQHTFCKKCLEEIVSTHKELRCPECRVLVDAKIDELPPNVLLMRILEGMRNAAPKKRSPGPNRIQGGSVAPAQTQPTMAPQQPMTPLTHPSFKQPQPSQPCARAIYDYIAKEPGDLSFKKGDIILLRKKIDTNWYQGEVGGCFGAFPLTYVQIITPLPNQIPQCKALYDFRMTNDDDEGCLTFNKGEVITVLRRIDENWAEGRLGDRIGIFPLAFVELNVIARALMKLSTNSQPGPSRVAPPTPTAEDTTPLIPTGVVTPLHAPPHSSPVPVATPVSVPAPTAPSVPAPSPAISTQAPPHLPVASAEQQRSSPLPPPLTTSESSSSGSSASSSSTTPNTSSSNTSSSSSTAPSSPTSPPPPPQPQASPAHIVAPTVAPAVATNVSPALAAAGGPAGAVTQHHHRDKRHSFNALHSQQTPSAPTPHHRHSAEILSCGGDGGGGSTIQASDSPAPTHHSSEAAVTAGTRGGGGRGGSGGASLSPAPDLLLQRQSSKRHRRTASSGDKLSAGNAASQPPPQGAYIALYPYKPQKTDELELKKGGIYLVTERCEDGWFKGTSNRTQKCGVFPGNYVTPASNWASCTPLPGVRLGPRGPASPNSLGPAPASPRQGSASSTPPVEPRLTAYARGKPAAPAALLHYSPRQHNGVTGQHLLHAPPPELPPRAASPGHGGPGDAGPSPWHGSPAVAPLDPPLATPSSTAPPSAPLGRSLSAVLGPSVTSSVSAPPNTSIPTTSASREKGKEKKDKAVSLMRRLTSMKKSKSPPPAAYSMDNPVFEDGSVAASPVHPTHTLHPVHVRSGSCPSQLLQALPIDASSAHHRLFGSGSQRLKHKDRPNVVMANLAHFGRAGDPVPCSSSSNHRKSNSLDATNGDAMRKVNKQLVPPVRERFRCIVPYPPMSEHELELRVGDIIYVHRKREDGWYKGTQQRTGRTGLFPASFVESF